MDHCSRGEIDSVGRRVTQTSDNLGYERTQVVGKRPFVAVGERELQGCQKEQVSGEEGDADNDDDLGWCHRCTSVSVLEGSHPLIAHIAHNKSPHVITEIRTRAELRIKEFCGREMAAHVLWLSLDGVAGRMEMRIAVDARVVGGRCAGMLGGWQLIALSGPVDCLGCWRAARAGGIDPRGRA